jgi:hypothetical protein
MDDAALEAKPIAAFLRLPWVLEVDGGAPGAGSNDSVRGQILPGSRN